MFKLSKNSAKINNLIQPEWEPKIKRLLLLFIRLIYHLHDDCFCFDFEAFRIRSALSPDHELHYGVETDFLQYSKEHCV